MQLSHDFELIQMADEYIAVPAGNRANDFHGVVVLSEPAFFLLSNMKESKTKDELIQLLTECYEIDAATASADLDHILDVFRQTGVITE